MLRTSAAVELTARWPVRALGRPAGAPDRGARPVSPARALSGTLPSPGPSWTRGTPSVACPFGPSGREVSWCSCTLQGRGPSGIVAHPGVASHDRSTADNGRVPRALTGPSPQRGRWPWLYDVLGCGAVVSRMASGSTREPSERRAGLVRRPEAPFTDRRPSSLESPSSLSRPPGPRQPRVQRDVCVIRSRTSDLELRRTT